MCDQNLPASKNPCCRDTAPEDLHRHLWKESTIELYLVNKSLRETKALLGEIKEECEKERLIFLRIIKEKQKTISERLKFLWATIPAYTGMLIALTSHLNSAAKQPAKPTIKEAPQASSAAPSASTPAR
jgi:hypothetical protein